MPTVCRQLFTVPDQLLVLSVTSDFLFINTHLKKVETKFVKIKIQSTNIKHTNRHINTQQRSRQKKSWIYELDNRVFIASSITNINEKVSQIIYFGCNKSK